MTDSPILKQRSLEERAKLGAWSSDECLKALNDLWFLQSLQDSKNAEIKSLKHQLEDLKERLRLSK